MTETLTLRTVHETVSRGCVVSVTIGLQVTENPEQRQHHMHPVVFQDTMSPLFDTFVAKVIKDFLGSKLGSMLPAGLSKGDSGMVNNAATAEMEGIAARVDVTLYFNGHRLPEANYRLIFRALRDELLRELEGDLYDVIRKQLY